MVRTISRTRLNILYQPPNPTYRPHWRRHIWKVFGCATSLCVHVAAMCLERLNVCDCESSEHMPNRLCIVYVYTVNRHCVSVYIIRGWNSGFSVAWTSLTPPSSACWKQTAQHRGVAKCSDEERIYSIHIYSMYINIHVECWIKQWLYSQVMENIGKSRRNISEFRRTVYASTDRV